MIFSSPIFLFGFLPIFLLLYSLSPAAGRNLVALSCSLFFYAWGEPVFVFIAIGSALLDFILARAIFASEDLGHRKLLVSVGVLANLGLLIWFKYTNFAVSNAQSIAHALFNMDFQPIG